MKPRSPKIRKVTRCDTCRMIPCRCKGAPKTPRHDAVKVAPATKPTGKPCGC